MSPWIVAAATPAALKASASFSACGTFNTYTKHRSPGVRAK